MAFVGVEEKLGLLFKENPERNEMKHKIIKLQAISSRMALI